MEMTQLQSLGDDELFDFLNNAPKYFREGEKIKKFQLKNGDYIHCVLWNYHFYITGTDIVKILVWRFQNSGRQMGNMKKFEEGIFSDLRNLKPGIDATLEGPRSDFLEFLYKNGCIRTQKKQKVFYWYSVPHDALFCDALERDLRRDTSIYTYNTYVNDRKSHYSEISYPGSRIQSSNLCIPKTGSQVFNQQYMHGKPTSAKAYDNPKNDIFNIKSTLFGNIKPHQGAFSHFGQGTDAQKEPLEKIFPLPFEPRKSESKIPQLEDYEDESKMDLIKSKIGSDLKRKFDDFDLDQLGFLKERCQEYSKSGCEKKIFKEHIQDNASKSINSTAKVRFIGMNNPDVIE